MDRRRRRRRRRCRDSGSSGGATWWDAAADSYVIRCGTQDSTGATRLCERTDQSSREPRNELPRARASLSLSVLCFFSLSVPLEYSACVPLSLSLFRSRSPSRFARRAVPSSFSRGSLLRCHLFLSSSLLYIRLCSVIPPLCSLLVSLLTPWDRPSVSVQSTSAPRVSLLRVSPAA